MIATVADYRLVTGDAATADADVTAALARAQKRAEDLTERLFDAVERTESLVPDADGKLWPTAYPVVSVTTPDTVSADADGISLSVGGYVGPGIFEDVWGFPASDLPGSPSPAPYLVTYTGGWPAGGAPQGLVDALCELASRYAVPADTRGVPAGVTSVTVGGDASQSYSGRALGGSSGIPASLRQQILRYRHVQARGAD